MIRIINKRSQTCLVKSFPVVIAAFFSSLLIFSAIPNAFGNDMNAVLVPTTNSGHVTYIADYAIDMRYPAGSSIARDLEGRNEYRFTVTGTSECVENGIADAIAAFNRGFIASNSPAKASEIGITYSANVRGTDTGALISYRIAAEVDLDNFVIGHDDGMDILDLEFRKLRVTDPIILHTPEHGSIDISRPIGILQAKYPAAAEKILASQAAEIFEEPVINFSAFDLPMRRWHVLFDPTASLVDAPAAGYVEIGDARAISIYSMGESSFREGVFEDERKNVTANIDGAQTTIESVVSRPSGSIHLAGFAQVADYGGEVAFVSQEQRGVGGYGMGFTLQVLLILGGMMGAIAVFILWKARK